MKRITIFALLAAIAIVFTGCAAQDADPVRADSQAEGHEALYDPAAAETEAAGEPNEEYISAGLTYENNMWYYRKTAIRALYDQNGGLYTNDTADGNNVLIEIQRDDSGRITKVAELTEEQFQVRIQDMK